MTDSSKTNDFKRRTIRLHKILDDKIEGYQKEELLATWTDAATDLLKKGLEKVKNGQKRW